MIILLGKVGRNNGEITSYTNLKSWIDIPFYPYFLHPDINNKTLIHPAYLYDRDVMSSVNIKELQHQYIVHNRAHRISSNDSNPCITKKRIVVDVSRSGLGNRILALTSAIMLSILMDRTLELQWDPNVKCASSYTDLFNPKKVTGPYYPFVYSDHRPYREERRIEQACYIHLTQLQYSHLSLLAQEDLFFRLNKDCHVLFIESNQYYAHILLSQSFNTMSLLLKKLSKSFFKDIAHAVFTPDQKIFVKIDKIKNEMGVFRKKTWMAIHVRGYYDGLLDKGAGLEWSFECVNKLLTKGHIDSVLFVTESLKSKQDALRLIDKKFLDRVITPLKEYVDDTIDHNDSFAIRDQMDQAVAEWYMIGEADYCMSPTVYLSTFSSSAINRGNCKYIDYKTRSHCDISAPSLAKEPLLYNHNAHLTTDLKKLNSVEAEALWESVLKIDYHFMEQCFSYDDPYNNRQIVHEELLRYYMAV